MRRPAFIAKGQQDVLNCFGFSRGQPVTGRCAFCGYKIQWTLLAGYGNQSSKNSTRSKTEHVRS
jgi:hypothetical protein